jgi:hypothetical protein
MPATTRPVGLENSRTNNQQRLVQRIVEVLNAMQGVNGPLPKVVRIEDLLTNGLLQRTPSGGYALGAAAVGRSVWSTPRNMGSIAFMRVNADNSVDYLSAEEFRAAIEVDNEVDDAAVTTVVTRVAGTALGGHLIVRSAGGLAMYADAGTEAHGDDVLGLTLGAVAAGAPVEILTGGPITEPSWAWTPGQPVMLGSDGVLVQSSIGDPAFDLVVGFAETPTTVFINIGTPIYY